MKMHYYKFDGAGNDFVLIDIRHHDPNLTTEQIAHICHRRFGVGADGLMTLGVAPEGIDFEMKYYNSDGRLGSMCGNGGRCIAMFAHMLGLGCNGHLDFVGYDGLHDADIIEWDSEKRKGIVDLGMRDIPVGEIRKCLDGRFLDTGSPHYVQYVNDLDCFDVFQEGRRIRNIKEEFPQGTNVDFVEELPDGSLKVRTYERGVEDETWACGTGVTACALVTGKTIIHAKGGDFSVRYNRSAEKYEKIRLIGPVSCNFEFDMDVNV